MHAIAPPGFRCPESRGSTPDRMFHLTLQSQAASGESSIEGSMTMETTPPQTFTGVSPASLKVYICRLRHLVIPANPSPEETKRRQSAEYTQVIKTIFAASPRTTGPTKDGAQHPATVRLLPNGLYDAAAASGCPFGSAANHSSIPKPPSRPESPSLTGKPFCLYATTSPVVAIWHPFQSFISSVPKSTWHALLYAQHFTNNALPISTTEHGFCGTSPDTFCESTKHG
jgi:hypothetical protein